MSKKNPIIVLVGAIMALVIWRLESIPEDAMTQAVSSFSPSSGELLGLFLLIVGLVALATIVKQIADALAGIFEAIMGALEGLAGALESLIDMFS